MAQAMADPNNRATREQALAAIEYGRLNADDRTTETLYKIPVVFHIVDDNPNAITDAYIETLVYEANKYIRAFFSVVPIQDQYESLVSDCEIEMFIARKDADCSSFSGITRTTTTATFTAGNNFDDVALKSIEYIDSERYLNVWICNLTGAGGYATFPGSVPLEQDGIVLTFFASQEYMAKALAHEVGHYLNLKHIWGNSSGLGGGAHTCADDDGISDTPLQYGNSDCTPNTTCGVANNYENMMDYGYPCIRMFTHGQRSEMRATLAGFRDGVQCEGGSQGIAVADIYYSNTIALPSLTKATRIFAGPNVSVLSGQNVTFQAFRSISLSNTFTVQNGAVFSASIVPPVFPEGNYPLCDGYPQIGLVPNVFSPNGDGVNDNYCVGVTNASNYIVSAFNNWGDLIYSGSGAVNSNPCCIWNGAGTNSGQTYFVTFTFENVGCSVSASGSSSVTVFLVNGGGGDSMAEAQGEGAGALRTLSASKADPTARSIVPNPASDAITVFCAEGDSEVRVLDAAGRKVRNLRVSDMKVDVDVSGLDAGLYRVQFCSADGGAVVKGLVIAR